jgi:hypothetical protein
MPCGRLAFSMQVTWEAVTKCVGRVCRVIIKFINWWYISHGISSLHILEFGPYSMLCIVSFSLITHPELMILFSIRALQIVICTVNMEIKRLVVRCVENEKQIPLFRWQRLRGLKLEGPLPVANLDIVHYNRVYKLHILSKLAIFPQCWLLQRTSIFKNAVITHQGFGADLVEVFVIHCCLCGVCAPYCYFVHLSWSWYTLRTCACQLKSKMRNSSASWNSWESTYISWSFKVACNVINTATETLLENINSSLNS